LREKQEQNAFDLTRVNSESVSNEIRVHEVSITRTQGIQMGTIGTVHDAGLSARIGIAANRDPAPSPLPTATSLLPFGTLRDRL
jgi:hypothetical protein